ncbi:hypothetical protein [Aeromicrobium piscarium]|nr:hypothetical protein [Aeromicrobium piscarium]
MRDIISIRSVVAVTLLGWATAATVAGSVYGVGRLVDMVRGRI